MFQILFAVRQYYFVYKKNSKKNIKLFTLYTLKKKNTLRTRNMNTCHIPARGNRGVFLKLFYTQ